MRSAPAVSAAPSTPGVDISNIPLPLRNRQRLTGEQFFALPPRERDHADLLFGVVSLRHEHPGYEPESGEMKRLLGTLGTRSRRAELPAF